MITHNYTISIKSEGPFGNHTVERTLEGFALHQYTDPWDAMKCVAADLVERMKQHETPQNPTTLKP